MATASGCNASITRKLEGSVEKAVSRLYSCRIAQRPLHPGLQPNPHVPADTHLWAALQNASGGSWAGCVYDAGRIAGLLQLGLAAEAAGRPKDD